jgi:putative transposase
MARLPRLHVPGGVYSIVLRGNRGQPIFRSDEDRVAFGRLVGKSLARHEARAFAYCWMESRVNLAVQVDEEPVERFVRGVAGPYARRVHRQAGIGGNLFAPRYIAVLVEEQELPALVRHIHWSPVRAGLVREPGEHAWSSHRAYLRGVNIPWLTTTRVLRRLARASELPQAAYADYMRQDNPPEYQSGFECGSPCDPRAFGSAQFLASLPNGTPEPRRLRASLDQLIDATAEVLDVTPEEIVSLSRRRPLALARAIVTWHAVRHRIATLSQVSRRLGRDSSTLLASVHHYRKVKHEYFGRLITELRPPGAR